MLSNLADTGEWLHSGIFDLVDDATSAGSQTLNTSQGRASRRLANTSVEASPANVVSASGHTNRIVAWTALEGVQTALGV
jgi:hypothetical protein